MDGPKLAGVARLGQTAESQAAAGTFDQSGRSLIAAVNKLADAQKAADERSARLDERLNTLISVVERHITGPDHPARR